MTIEERKRIASLGGKASQASGNGRRWDSEGARAAGNLEAGHDKRKLINNFL